MANASAEYDDYVFLPLLEALYVELLFHVSDSGHPVFSGPVVDITLALCEGSLCADRASQTRVALVLELGIPDRAGCSGNDIMIVSWSAALYKHHISLNLISYNIMCIPHIPVMYLL